MRTRIAVLAILCAVLVGCEAAAPPSASPAAASSTPEIALASPSPAAPAVATPKPTPRPTRKPTPVPVPPKPTGVKFDQDSKCLDSDCNRARITQTVLWRAPRMKAVEIRVYGVTECLAMPAHPEPGAGGSCLVEHTALPASVRRLLATAPATAGRVSWSWKMWTGCEDWGLSSPPGGRGYRAIVIAAYNASSHSIFAIAAPGQWYVPELDDFC
jgi:hypothetical protein